MAEASGDLVATLNADEFFAADPTFQDPAVMEACFKAFDKDRSVRVRSPRLRSCVFFFFFFFFFFCSWWLMAVHCAVVLSTLTPLGRAGLSSRQRKEILDRWPIDYVVFKCGKRNESMSVWRQEWDCCSKCVIFYDIRKIVVAFYFDLGRGQTQLSATGFDDVIFFAHTVTKGRCM